MMKRTLLAAALCAAFGTAAAQQTTPRNQLTPTPPMGWMTWNLFQGNLKLADMRHCCSWVDFTRKHGTDALFRITLGDFWT